jgi:tRNA G18 (ribose-2'-O)-methylase SpoU
VIAKPPNRELECRDTIVAVDLADPGNLGTLIRTAAALGWQVAIIGGVDPWSPKVLRASAGTQFSQPAIVISDVGELVAADLSPWATVVAGGVTLGDLETTGPMAVLVGNESHGLDSGVVGACRGVLTIPMAASTESLNAAVAGAIAMYALGGKRRYGETLS